MSRPYGAGMTTTRPRTSTTRRGRFTLTVVALVISGAVLTGCSVTNSNADGSSSSSGSSTTSAADAAKALTDAPDPTGTVVEEAEAFAATLTSGQKSTLMQEYSLANAEKWSNLPQALSRNRIGLQTGTLTVKQWSALGTLLKTVTGGGADEGYQEILELLNADDYLAANGGGADYGRGNYYIAFLGSPSATGTWELQFGGHHTAVSDTYTDGKLVGATPSFRGVEPFASFEENGVTNQPLATEKDALAAMLKGLTSSQLASAKLSQTYSDLLLTPGKDWSFPAAKEGVKVSTLSADEQALVIAAINTYVDDLDAADAKTILAKYTAELADTYVSYSGTTDLTTQNDYVRIDGPSVWIEFSMQHGIVLSGNHPHSVWRDRTTDYGGTKS